jgi:hypothetical protein
MPFRFVLLRRSPAFQLGLCCLGPFHLALFCLGLFCLSLLSHAITPAFVPGIANYMIRVSFGTEALADAKLVGCVPQNFTPHRKKQAECEKECFLLVPKRLGD